MKDKMKEDYNNFKMSISEDDDEVSKLSGRGKS